MKIARVIGTVVNTIKLDCLNGYKLLWVEPLDETGKRSEPAILAVDTVQAGIGNIVLLCQEGKSSRLVMNSKDAPVEAVILGIIDSIEIPGRQTFLEEKNRVAK
ncbi:EutN/CcmL family microcompartment protein [Myxococcota bacterium]|nr:EutN/CcmL family microcompartment protein [Myxococcota bacterium]MBU1380237.1 EutN/CcmL family microcompartment protein [Myxococcota bacterium]MBU1499103.1 EutN/CcmL family microcompartment protein [Myxococcota bacterium]